jgi:hypothetical protein
LHDGEVSLPPDCPTKRCADGKVVVHEDVNPSVAQDQTPVTKREGLVVGPEERNHHKVMVNVKEIEVSLLTKHQEDRVQELIELGEIEHVLPKHTISLVVKTRRSTPGLEDVGLECSSDDGVEHAHKHDDRDETEEEVVNCHKILELKGFSVGHELLQGEDGGEIDEWYSPTPEVPREWCLAHCELEVVDIVDRGVKSWKLFEEGLEEPRECVHVHSEFWRRQPSHRSFLLVAKEKEKKKKEVERNTIERKRKRKRKRKKRS